jgi:hypothetical protein
MARHGESVTLLLQMGTNLHKPGMRLPPAVYSSNNKYNNSDHQNHQGQAGVKTRAENIPHQFTTC